MGTIAFLGTGLLGAGFVEAACARGETVHVWNRTIAKAEALAAFGAIVCRSPAEAVRGAERVHLVLTDDAAVAEVIAQLRPGLGAEAVLVDHSTTLPATTAARAASLAAAGIAYLHCPVFIGPAAARQSKGIIMVSGPAAHYERVRAALARQAETVRYLGERTDLAAVHKLVGNGLLLGLAGLIADVFAVAVSSDVPAPEALQVLEYFNPGAIIQGRGKKMSVGDYSASFELTMARKDIGLMMTSAGALPLAVLPGMAARMDALIGRGYGDREAAVIALESVAEAR